MKPVRQTVFGKGKGNCFSACIASILDLPVEEVPAFCDEDQDADGSTWLERTARWLNGRGWGLVYINWAAAEHMIPLKCWVILTGRSPRATGPEDDLSHAVVCWANPGQQVEVEVDGEKKWSWQWKLEYHHDPHPDETYLVGDPIDVIMLVPAG